MVSAHAPNLEPVQASAGAAPLERNSVGVDEPRPLFDQIRRETFGEQKFRPEPPTTLFDQAREAPINFYLSNPDSVPKKPETSYEIPDENRLSTFSKALNYTTHAWAYGLMGISAGIAISKNPFVRAGCSVLMAACGVSEAKYSIHGQELKDLKIKESVLFPK